MYDILIVDDDQVLCQLFEKRLLNAGYRVYTAQNGREGLALAQAHEPDLILLDLHMPHMDGFQVLEKLRQAEWGRQIKVVIITADANQPHTIDQTSGVLKKPVLRQELLTTVERTLAMVNH